MTIEENSSPFVWATHCNVCFRCKIRVFKNFKDFTSWIEQHEVKLRGGWKKIFEREKKITSYRCILQPNRIVVTRPGSGSKLKNKEGLKCWHFEGC